MKLRNKNTGEIVELKLIQVNDKYLEDHEVNFLNGEQLTLKMLSDSFNDVKEPLIKDEKIRKAVRAWADAWGFDRVYAYGDDHTNTTRLENGNAGVGIEIDDSRIEPLDKRKCYTIAELCGEEEE